MRNIIAPTVELATPIVEQFAEKIRKLLGAQMLEFYTCNPSSADISDRKGGRWVEGSWGLDLLYRGPLDIYDVLDNLRYSEVEVSELTIYPYGVNTLKLRFWLTARVKGHSGESEEE
jgi:hypothetical protein